MNKYLVEFLGTMFLMFVIFATGHWVAIGAALAIAVMLGGAISGGAYNPAVAVSLYAAGKLPKSYGGGMKKTYFLNSIEEILKFSPNDLICHIDNLKNTKPMRLT